MNIEKYYIGLLEDSKKLSDALERSRCRSKITGITFLIMAICQIIIMIIDLILRNPQGTGIAVLVIFLGISLSTYIDYKILLVIKLLQQKKTR